MIGEGERGRGGERGEVWKRGRGKRGGKRGKRGESGREGRGEGKRGERRRRRYIIIVHSLTTNHHQQQPCAKILPQLVASDKIPRSKYQTKKDKVLEKEGGEKETKIKIKREKNKNRIHTWVAVVAFSGFLSSRTFKNRGNRSAMPFAGST